MDPYKVLNLPQTADMEACRQKAKTLFKRYMEERNKFDAKKVLEAFEMIKRAKKKAHSSNTTQILGRGRKERELDGLFNKQTKKIKKDSKRDREKRRMIAKQMQRRGGSAANKQAVLAMRDKMRSRRSRRSHRRSREKQEVKPPPRKKRKEGPVANDPLDALYKIIQHLPNEKKFHPAMGVLYRWITEVMTDPDEDKEHLFYALQTAYDTGFHVCKEIDKRLVVLKVFRHVLTKHDWFATADEKRLKDVWQLGVVTQNECLSDDQFEFHAALNRLRKVLAVFPTEDEREAQYEQERSQGPTPGPSPSPGASPGASPPPSPAPSGERKKRPPKTPAPLASPSEDDPPPTYDVPIGPPTQAEELTADFDDTGFGPVQGPAPPCAGPALPDGTGPAPLQGVKRARSDDGVVDCEGSDSGSDRSDSASGSEAGSDAGSEAGSDAGSEAGSDAGSDAGSEAGEKGGCEAFRPPTEDEAEDLMLIGFVDCLGVLLERAAKSIWARPAISDLFTHTYIERSRIPEPLRTKIVNWQADLKRGIKDGFREDQLQVNSILDSKNVVVDGREDRVSFEAGAGAWANKQFGFGAETHI